MLVKHTLLADAVAGRELRADTNTQALARSIEITLGGSFTLRPYLVQRKNNVRQR